MARVLVTGGAGFIGSHIVDTFLMKGDEVAVIDNLSTGSKDNLSPKARLYEMDIRDSGAGKVIADFAPEIAVHTAAQVSVRSSMEDPVEDARVNIVGMLQVLTALKPYLPYVVFTSTGGAIYGEQEMFPAPESHRIKPECPYGLSKYASELYLDFFARASGLHSACLRLANVYGPRQNSQGEAGVVAIFSEKLARRQSPTINGTGRQTRDFVSVKDVARAVAAACEKKVAGVYNIGTGIETSILEVYEILCRSLEVDIAPECGPAKAGEQMRSSIDPSLAQRTFGWKAHLGVEEGLRETALWFKAKVRV